VPQFTYGVSLSGGGVSIQKVVTRTGDHPNAYEVSLPAGKAVTAWVKTDANTAACNLPTGHGYTNGKFDVYWSGGMRYGVDGVITGDAIALDGGAGTDFPASATSGVVVCKQVSINSVIDGDALEIIGLSLEYASPTSTSVGHVDMQDSGPATVTELDLSANAPLIYDIDGGAANVFTGNPITVTKASHNDTSNSATLKIVALEDSTP
jgi:hypothetical protein